MAGRKTLPTDANKTIPSTSTAAAGASFLILISVVSRLVTFALNQLLLRFYLSPVLLGASAQLELYSITVLTFARESVRVTLQRQTGNPQAVVNLAYISILLGALFSVAFAWLYESRGLPDVLYMAGSLKLYSLACVIEVAAEPAFAVAQLKLLYRVRAEAETLATLARCVGTFASASYLARSGDGVGTLPFACGQTVYASVLLAVYTFRIRPIAARNKFSLILSPISSSPSSSSSRSALEETQEKNDGFLVGRIVSRAMVTLWVNLYMQESVKYVLTQGDSFIVSSMASLHDQGAYALASNYGGLIARMLFQPIEESSRNLFAKLCAPAVLSSSNSSSSHATSNNINSKSSQSARSQEEAARSNPSHQSSLQARTALVTMLRVYSILALFAFSLGPRAAPLALRLVLGKRFASASASSADAGGVLAAYTYLIPALAYNGLTEAFVSSVSTPAQLRTQSILMVVWSVAFGIAAWVFIGGGFSVLAYLTGLGSGGVVDLPGGRGIVWANLTHYLLRTMYNFSFVQRWFANQGASVSFADTLPSGTAVAAAILAWAILRQSILSPEKLSILEQLMALVGVATGLAVIVAWSERQTLRETYRRFVGSRLRRA